MVSRIYVEKKPGASPKASQLAQELRNFLGIASLQDVRELVRYDAEGISEAALARALKTVFSEPPVDSFYLEEYPEKEGFSHPLVIQALPGQFDQRADSCAQCIQLLYGGERPKIASAQVYEFKGALTNDDLKKIEDYLLNPVEAHVVGVEKPATLTQKVEVPKPVATIEGFTSMNEEELEELRESLGLAMDFADIRFLQRYFSEDEKRDPTITEIRVVDTYWSDHCRHTTFSTHLEAITIHDEEVAEAFKRYLALREKVYGEQKASARPKTLMDIATLGTKALKKAGKLPELDESDEINACSIHVGAQVNGRDEDWLFMFKNETHNHPTEIEPFGGAATCIGGCIRDPLSGRAYVHQAMRITGSGDPRTPFVETLPAKLPQKKIATTAAEGYSSYGNQIGLATGFVRELYDEGFVAKHLECGAVVAAAPADHVRREAPAAGDVVILLGGRTGRDGIGGATGSSKSHGKNSLSTMASEVQKGNAPEERKIQRLFRNKEVTRLIKRCNDFGAGGVSVAIGELAPGLEIDLDAVRKKYEGMDGTELAISESQERMACVVAASDVEKFCQMATTENLEAYPVANVTEEPRMKMMWQGQEIANLSRAFLDTNGADRTADVLVNAETVTETSVEARTEAAAETVTEGVEETGDKSAKNATNKTQLSASENFSSSENKNTDLKELMCQLNSASQRGLVERFDSTVGAGSLLMPYGGRYQRTPSQVMAALLPVMPDEETKQAGLMAFGCDLETLVRNPYKGAYQSVVDSLAKVVAAGAHYKKAYLTLQEYFEKLGAEPDRWGKPFAALLGALDAQLDFEAAAIGGKDSMSGTFMDLDVPPTVLSFAVAPIKSDELISNEFKAPSHYIYMYGAQTGQGASSGTGTHSRLHTNPNPDAKKLKAAWDSFDVLAQGGKVKAAYALDKTPAEAIINMSFGNRIGFKEDEATVNTQTDASAPALIANAQAEAGTQTATIAQESTIDWFTRYPGALIIETAEPLTNDHDEFSTFLGMTQKEPTIELAGQKESILELLSESEKVLESVYPTNASSPEAPQQMGREALQQVAPTAPQQSACEIEASPATYTAQSTPALKTSAKQAAPLLSYDGPTGSSHANITVAKPRVAIPVFPGTNCEYDSARACLSAGLEPSTHVIKNLTPETLEESARVFENLIRKSQIIFLPGGFSGGDEPDGSAKFIVSFLKNERLKEAIHDLLDNRDGLMLGICNGFQALIKLGLVPFGHIVDVNENAPTLTYNQIGRHQSSIAHIRVASAKSPWMQHASVGEVFEVPISHGEGRFVANQEALKSLAENGQVLTQYCDIDGLPSMETSFNPNGSDWAIEGITSADGRILGKMGHAERVGLELYKNVAGNYEMGLFKSAKEYFA